MSTIQAISLGKRYRRLSSGRPRTLRSVAERRGVSEYWAMRDVNFHVAPGETFGIIGENGSGKSTLLRVLAGVTRQTEGKLEVDGDVGAVLTLGGGFHPMLTAEENALTGALLGGLTREEALAGIPDIAEFAELEAEMSQPLRMLSDGQRMRLAFSVAVHNEPRILVLDEVLAVGDLRFQDKCFEKLESLQRNGVTIVVVSHDMAQIRRLCERVLWIEAGQVREVGKAAEVTHHYQQLMQRHGDAVETDTGGWRLGTREVEITGIRLLDPSDLETSHIATGDRLVVSIQYTAKRRLEDVIFGFSIHGRGENRTVLDIDSMVEANRGFTVAAGSHTLRIVIDRLDLAGGSYLLDVGVYSADWEETYDYFWEALPLDVKGTGDTGQLSPPTTWESN